MDNRNLILALVLSVVILFGFQYLYELVYPQPESPLPSPDGPVSEVTPTPETAVPTAPGAAPPPPTEAAGKRPDISFLEEDSRKTALADSPRLPLVAPRLKGSISLVGGRLDDLILTQYRQTLAPDSPAIEFLWPPGTPDAYFAEVGWVTPSGGVEVPGPTTEWTADGTELTPDSPVTLTWVNGAGLTFKRTFAVDDGYMFTVTQTVENGGTDSASISPYALLSRRGLPQISGFFILHEGPLGVFNDKLKEVDYDEVAEAGSIVETSDGGWIGITDKYWLAALVPDQSSRINGRFFHERLNGVDRFQVDFVTDQMTVAPGESITYQSRIFAGAKRARMLDEYAQRYGIPLFDRAIDFGWFWFLTKPLFYALLWIYGIVGNFGVAILILTVFVKLLFFPLANKSYKAMSQMRRLQPEMKTLRERFGDDKVRLNQEMMALYKREKVNPASGCLPMLIQIPVFFALYKVLFVTIEMRHAPFFGWIQDLSAKDPTSMWNLFGLIPWDPALHLPEPINIGLWPLIMGITMFLQQKLNPQPPDPIQAKIFMFLPLIFTVMLAQFPAGLVIYWTWNNVLSIAQQWVIMRRAGTKSPTTTTGG